MAPSFAHTFSPGGTAYSAEVNANFSAVATYVNAYLTSSQVLSPNGGSNTAPSFSRVGDTNTGMYFSAAGTLAWTLEGTKKLELSATGLAVTNALTAASLDIAGGIQAGSGNVDIIDSTGKIPAISSTYFASLSAANLTAVPAAQLSGTITSATQDLITRTGTVTSGTWSGSFGAVSGANLTSLTAANLSGTIANAVQDNITRLGTITSGVWNAGSVKSSSTVTVAASNQLYMDGGGDTYFIENGANVLSAYAGGNLIWSVPSGTAYLRVEDYLSINTGAAPGLSLGGTVGGSHYGSGSTNWLATPDVWFYIKRNSNAVTYAVPGYGL